MRRLPPTFFFVNFNALVLTTRPFGIYKKIESIFFFFFFFSFEKTRHTDIFDYICGEGENILQVKRIQRNSDSHFPLNI